WLSDLYNGSQAMLNDQIANLKTELAQQRTLNDELQTTRSQLEAHKRELTLLLATHADAKIEMESYIQRLTTSIKMEQTRVQELENQFLVLLGHQESGQRYAENLEGLLTEINTVLATKQSQLDTVSAAHAESVGTLLSHLDHTDMALEEDQAQQQ